MTFGSNGIYRLHAQKRGLDARKKFLGNRIPPRGVKQSLWGQINVF